MNNDIRGDLYTYLITLKQLEEILKHKNYTKLEIKKISNKTCITEHMLEIVIANYGGIIYE